jgi:hypothetical protein
VQPDPSEFEFTARQRQVLVKSVLRQGFPTNCGLVFSKIHHLRRKRPEAIDGARRFLSHMDFSIGHLFPAHSRMGADFLRRQLLLILDGEPASAPDASAAAATDSAAKSTEAVEKEDKAPAPATTDQPDAAAVAGEPASAVTAAVAGPAEAAEAHETVRDGERICAPAFECLGGGHSGSFTPSNSEKLTAISVAPDGPPGAHWCHGACRAQGSRVPPG